MLGAAVALDPDFLADAPYDEEALLFDEVLEVDREESLIRVRMPTRADLPLTSAQRVHPTRHPRHVNGGLIVHMTAMVGFAHAYYVLDLRHREGWVGYGAKIANARYRELARVGDPIEILARATAVRRRQERVVARYDFCFTQSGRTVYTSDQTAMFLKVA